MRVQSPEVEITKLKTGVAGDYEIQTTILRPNGAWVNDLIRATRSPILRMYLDNANVITEWRIKSRTNGAVFDLRSFLATWVDLIKTEDREAVDWDRLISLNEGVSGEELLNLNKGVEDEEFRSWVRFILNPFSAMPGMRAIQVSQIEHPVEVVPVLHEAMHVRLGHSDIPDTGNVKGARKLLFQESEASDLALVEFIKIADVLDLSTDDLYRAKRLLDFLYFSYVIGFEAGFGGKYFSGIRELDLTESDKETVKHLILWMIRKYGLHL